MKNEDWKRVEQALSAPYGSATLMCDGYELTLFVFHTKMRLEIAWYVNGKFRAEWLMEDTDIRRRFARQSERRIHKGKHTAKDKALMKRIGMDLDAKIQVYSWGWKSPGALIRHLKKTCQAVVLLEINHYPLEDADAQVSE
ncbi:hypothetical protein [Desulfobotulus sp.]|uniref:hypothetical protein n=1 Tax=Desulfobotulus sp. TaxID=1940337 RepID=UPI002A36026D|nr:hypothetical protein [Desulfobotulus sp.]MDY0164643.1 hypothetical protein [Desulfobotulus sp.]